MKFLFRLAVGVGAWAIVSSAGFTGERLMLMGGGDVPGSAFMHFCEWAGGRQAKILDVTWATESPDETYQDVVQAFAPCKPTSVEHALRAPFSADQKAALLQQMRRASAIYFSGGDQVRIMNVLADRELLAELRQLYRKGIPFGGTSAGTAIMSAIMITGEGNFQVIDGRAVETREGLGLLPAGVLVDQHFIVRQRENRLFGLLLDHPGLIGIGVDEGSVLFVTENAEAEVPRASTVMAAVAPPDAPKGSLNVRVIRGPARFSILTH